MKAFYCEGRVNRSLLVGSLFSVVAAAVVAACALDGPAPPRKLFLTPVCEGVCTWGGPFAASNDWLKTFHGAAGATITIVAEVTDSSLHAVPGARLRWAVVHGQGAIDSTTVTSDSAAIVRLHWSVDTLARPDSLRVWFPSGDSALAVATVQHTTAVSAVKASGDSQVVTAGATPQPFVIRVTDRYGNPVPGVRVAWTVGGLGAVTTLTTTTDASGESSNTLRAPDQAGVYAVIATFGTVSAVVFRVAVK